MSSIRAYRQQDHFIERTEQAVRLRAPTFSDLFPADLVLSLVHSQIDVENRAYFLSIALQRWLGVRLDFLGSILILGIGLFGVGFRDVSRSAATSSSHFTRSEFLLLLTSKQSVDPSKLGVVLTYSLSVTAVFSQLVSTFATVEQGQSFFFSGTRETPLKLD